MPKFFSIQTCLYLLGYRDDISLGKCFHYGIHTQKDLKVARTYYLQALKAKKYLAFHQLSLLSRDEGRIGESFYYLGLYYEQAKDWEQALAAYEKAANENHVFAMYRAGKLFAVDRLSKQHQVIIKKDIIEELLWYRKAAANYSAHALDALLELSAKEPKASLHLAQMYEQGEIGNKKVMSTAFNYYEKAHEMQEQAATCRLGRFYELGEAPVSQNLQKSFDYYVLATKEKNKLALDALAALERIVKILDNNSFSFQLAVIYRDDFDQSVSAFKCYQLLANKGDEIALVQMQKLADKNTDCAYELAKIYEENNQSENHLQIAYHYFARAMRGRHRAAQDHLESLAESGDAAAQYTLADSYYYQQCFDKAIAWCLQAAEQHYQPAVDFLKNAPFTKGCYLFIAKTYEQGQEGIAKNNDLALYFYEKSYAAGSKEAAFYLGQRCQCFDESGNSNPFAFKKAGDYFIKAAQWGYAEADCAYELAKLYEKNTHIKNHLEIAYRHFAKAMLNHHDMSREYLASLADSGDAAAQYTLANTYYQQQFFDKAIDWCLKAVEQRYEPACYFLKNSPFTKADYLFIAKSYEQGKEGIAKNNDLALYFYEKAIVEKDQEAAFHLGQLYQADNEEKAFDYFVKAAQWGHSEALLLLERLAAELNPNKQLQLANLYRDPPFKNENKALYWGRQAIIASANSSSLSDKALIKLIEDTEKNISFENLKVFSQKIARESVLTASSLFNFLK